LISVGQAIARFSEASEPYRKTIELVLLVLGVLYGAAFIVRTWAFPAADIKLSVSEREMRSGEPDILIIDASFAVSSNANIRVDEVKTECAALDVGVSCVAATNCSAESRLIGYLTPRGETQSWACMFRVPTGNCARVVYEISGRGAGFASKPSNWRASLISCGKDRN
jgi:hypothetical protein